MHLIKLVLLYESKYCFMYINKIFLLEFVELSKITYFLMIMKSVPFCIKHFIFNIISSNDKNSE